MKRPRSLSCFAAATVLYLLTGCASIKVKLVTDANKGTLEGFRYYLPRPYLVVDKPFPLAGVDQLVTFEWEEGMLKAVDYDSLPADIKAALPKTGLVSPQSVVAADLGGRFITQSAPAGGATAPAKPIVLPTADWTKYLDKEKTKADPTLLAKEATGFKLAAELKKDAPFATVTSAKIVLVPCDENGVPLPDALVEIPDQAQAAAFAKGTAAGVYTANGRRTDIATGVNFALGLLVDGKTDSAEGKFLVHQSAPSFVVIGGKPAQAPAAPVSPAGTETEITGGKAVAKLAGDATTQPLRKINDYFSILQMPDFDQQYAVQLRSGLGQAELDLALKDGWLLEKAGFKVDNTEIGKFVFKNIQKFADLAEAVARASWLPATMPTPPAAETNTVLAGGGRSAGTRFVTLRVQALWEAQPGIYPVLKPSEYEAAKTAAAAAPTTLYTPVTPLTVIAFNVRKSVVFELQAGTKTLPPVQASEVANEGTLLQNNLRGSSAGAPTALDLARLTVKASGTPGAYEVAIPNAEDKPLADAQSDSIKAWFKAQTEWKITDGPKLTEDKKAVVFTVKPAQ